jgi:hypothetical protein
VTKATFEASSGETVGRLVRLNRSCPPAVFCRQAALIRNLVARVGTVKAEQHFFVLKTRHARLYVDTCLIESATSWWPPDRSGSFVRPWVPTIFSSSHSILLVPEYRFTAWHPDCSNERGIQSTASFAGLRISTCSWFKHPRAE